MPELTDAQKVVRNDTAKRMADALEALAGTGGRGLPAGGTDGDVLVKNGAEDYAARWTNAPTFSNYRTAAAQDVIDTGLNSAVTSLGTQTNSVEWTPASGDTLLAFILANCTRTKLPFSFIKIGNNTVSDAPTDINSKEFTGFVYGSGDRIVVQVERYIKESLTFYQRPIYQNSWNSTKWIPFTKSEQPVNFTDTITKGQYTIGGRQNGKWTNGIAEIQGTLQMSGYQSNSTIFSVSKTLFKGNIFGLIYTDGGGKTWYPRVRDSGTAIEVYLNTTLVDGWYNFFMIAFNDSF